MAGLIFSAEDKWLAVQREVAMRKRVYARMVADGRMKAEMATWGIAVMEAIALDYAEQVSKERLL